MLLLAQLMELDTWAWMIQQQHLQPLLPLSLHLLLALLPSAMPAPSKMPGVPGATVLSRTAVACRSHSIKPGQCITDHA